MPAATSSIRSVVRRGALGGGIAGLLACAGGVSYILENGSRTIGGIGWAGIGAVFVAQLALSGAALGGLLAGVKVVTDRVVGRRTVWGPAMASGVAMAIAAAPSAAFGAVYFGSLHAPFMGTAAIFTIASIIALGIAFQAAWNDQREDDAAASTGAGTRLRRSLFASIGLVLPIVALGALGSAMTSDNEVLHAFRASPGMLGAAAGAGLGGVFGLYAGLVVGMVRLMARPRLANATPPARARIAVLTPMPTEAKEVDEDFDPLAEEDAELEARFAELDRLERASRMRA